MSPNLRVQERDKEAEMREAKASSLAFWRVMAGFYTKVVESVSAQTLLIHIENYAHKGSVYFIDAFRSYQSLQRFGKPEPGFFHW